MIEITPTTGPTDMNTLDANGYYVKRLQSPTSGKRVKQVTVGENTYHYNPAYKTYNRDTDNELLKAIDLKDIDWSSSG